jgi:two-component sensor histidine kinase
MPLAITAARVVNTLQYNRKRGVYDLLIRPVFIKMASPVMGADLKTAAILKSPSALARDAPPLGSTRATALGIILVALGLGAKLPLDALAGASLPPFITIYLLLPVIGFFAGFRVGIVTVAIAAVSGAFFWMLPLGGLPHPNMLTILTLGAFGVGGTLTVRAGYLSRIALQKLAVQQLDAQRNAKEAVHRTRNLLSVVKALALQEAKRATSVETFNKDLSALLTTISREQDMLVGEGPGAASLGELVERVTEHCRRYAAFHVIPGPAMQAPADTLGLTLALHELCTNSLKYGALSDDAGKITLTWTDAGGLCELTWLEAINSTAAPHSKEGLGSALIRNALAKQEGGKVEYLRTPRGIDCRFRWPSKSLS